MKKEMVSVGSQLAVIDTKIGSIETCLCEIKTSMKDFHLVSKQCATNAQQISDMKEESQNKMTMWGIIVGGASLIISFATSLFTKGG